MTTTNILINCDESSNYYYTQFYNDIIQKEFNHNTTSFIAALKEELALVKSTLYHSNLAAQTGFKTQLSTMSMAINQAIINCEQLFSTNVVKLEAHQRNLAAQLLLLKKDIGTIMLYLEV